MKSNIGTTSIEAKDLINIIKALKDSNISSFECGDIKIELNNLTKDHGGIDNGTNFVPSGDLTMKEANTFDHDSELLKQNKPEAIDETLKHLMEENFRLENPEAFEDNLKIGN